MIRELLFELHTVLRNIAGSGAVLVLFFGAMLLFVLFFSKNRERKIWAMFLSVLGIIAAAVTETVDRVRNDARFRPAQKYAALAVTVCLVVLAIAASGKSVFSEEFNTKAENDMHIPGGLESAMEDILRDADTPVVLVMPGWRVYFESYSSGFELLRSEPEGNDPSTLDEDGIILYTELERSSPDMKKVASVAKRRGCEYVVLSDDIWPEVPITKCGYDVFCEYDGCRVYKEVSAP